MFQVPDLCYVNVKLYNGILPNIYYLNSSDSLKCMLVTETNLSYEKYGSLALGTSVMFLPFI